MSDRVGQFEVNFRLQMVIKGQVLVDFIAKFSYSNTAEVIGTTKSTKAAKAAGVREKENLYLQNGMLNSRPYMWTTPTTIRDSELA